MRFIGLCGAIILAWTASAAAQEGGAWAPASCEGLEAGSFEAELLGCDPAALQAGANSSPEPSDQPGREPDAESRPAARADRLHETPERPPVEATAGAERPDETLSQDQVRPTRSAEVEVVEPEVELEDIQPEPEIRDGRGRDDRALRIPNGHWPPPGSCRVWFPDRPPGQQPPPTSCDVEVPEGAVLIRG